MYRKDDGSIREKGAITVFLALIFISLIIFAGAVIDIVRIAAASRKVQSALNTSARSLLANYDRELIGGYGIYGTYTSADSTPDEFFRYMRANLQEHHDGISFINVQLDHDDVEVTATNSLLDNDAFKKQIQEYMKYRMPIIFSNSLIEQLKDIKLDKKLAFAEAEKQTRGKAKELRNKANAVNAKLAGIKSKLGKLSAAKLEDLKRELLEALELSSTISYNGNGLLDDYQKSKEKANKIAEEGEFIPNRSQEFEAILENNDRLAPGLQKWLTEVKNTLSVVKPMEEEVKDLEEELEDLRDELADLKDSGTSSDDASESMSEEIDAVRDKIERVKESIEELEADIDEELSDLQKKLEGLFLDGYILKEESVQLIGSKTDDLKSFINKKKEEIAGTLLRRLEKAWLINAEEFNASSLAASDDFALMDENSDYNSSMKEDKAEKSNDAILKSIEKLSKAIERAASGTMEKLNTIEYIMDKYTFLTSKTERKHYFRKGEVEYIICGSDLGEPYSSLRNTEYFVVTEVLLQVWALRFAIDTIDEYVRSIIVFPPQRLAFALMEGALDSCLDMFNMLNGEEVPICPESFTAVRLKYSDHLRILLLMKPEEELLRKARQLMQVNIKHMTDSKTGAARSDFRIADYSTAISAKVEAKVNLFFLPLLKVDKLMPGSFEEGRYIIRKQIHLGY